MWIKCYDSTVLSNFSFDFNLTAYIGKCCSGSEVRTNTLFDRKSEVRKRSSLYNSFFLFSFFGKPTFRDRSRTARFANSGSDTVGSKKEKETDAGTDLGRGAEFSSTFLISRPFLVFAQENWRKNRFVWSKKKDTVVFVSLFGGGKQCV